MKFLEKLRWFFLGTELEVQRARRLVKIIILLVLFSCLFWIIPIGNVFRALLKADPLYITLGLVLTIISASLTAVELEPLIRKQGIKRSILQILAINLSVKFYTLFAPSTLIASGVRWYRFAQPEGKVAQSLVALAFYRLLEDFLTLSLGLGFWILSGGKEFQVNPGWIIILIMGIILFWTLVTRISMPVYLWLKQRTGHFWDRPVRRDILRRFEKLIVAVSDYADMTVIGLLIAIIAGLVSVLTGMISALYLAKSIGIELSFLQIGWIYSIVLLATQLPFTVAGGLGVREVTLVAILPSLGISADLALAFSFLLFIRGIPLSLLGGLIELVRSFRFGKSPDACTNQNDTKET